MTATRRDNNGMVKGSDVVGADLSQIFDNDVFRFTQEHAKEIPVPKPERLTEEIKNGTLNAAQKLFQKAKQWSI
jgi:hypothetical protein